jgi:predicted metal-dependent hydrolase
MTDRADGSCRIGGPRSRFPSPFRFLCIPPDYSVTWFLIMSKADRIEAFAQELAGKQQLEWADFLTGYIRLFNEQRYYEAHDVLEHLWLQPTDPGSSDKSSDFAKDFGEHSRPELESKVSRTASSDKRSENALLKGLIQFAGAFVHLQKQFQRPDHPTDGRRLRPAWRLFKLAHKNLLPFGIVYRGFQVESALRLSEQETRLLENDHFRSNPWNPENAPRLPDLLNI